MSVINKTPYIEQVVASLSKENLTSLQSLLNGTGTKIFRSFINQTDTMSTSDKGVAHMVLEAKDHVFTGYLLYNNSYCVLVAYEGGKSQKMFILKLDYANDKYEIVDEELDINEFRRVVEDRSVNVEVEGNDVEANPELEGEEAELVGLEVDGTKYKVFGSAGLLLDNIKDADGHKRFIGGAGNKKSALENAEEIYNKWCLDGNHLTFVACFKIPDTVGTIEFSGGQTLVEYLSLPNWIIDKIYPLHGGTNGTILRTTLQALNNAGSGIGSSGSAALYKYNNNVYISTGSGVTIGQASTETYLRLQFDFLIF